MRRSLAELGGAKVGVLGLARSGLAAIGALRRAGAEVIAYDDRAAAVEAALRLGASAGPLEGVASLDLLVVSPGVPLTHPAPHPVIEAARRASVPLTADIELFAASYPQNRIVGITGTNGKSTTTALIHHLLVTAGQSAVVGGNIGRPVFDLGPLEPGQTAVLELSSFQLELCRELRCHIAVWLNLAPDHLDRHGDLEGYIAAKERIFANQAASDWAVVGVEDPASARVADGLERQGRKLVRLGQGRTVEGGIGVMGDMLYDAIDGKPRPVAQLKGLRGLRGAHNQQNAAAAYASLRCLGLSPTLAALGLGNFAGLPHRMEEVGRIDGVVFVNDSKATNPDAATRSLGSYENVFWIAGGQAKPGGFAAMLPFLQRVRGAYLIGSAESEIARAIAGRTTVHRCGTLDRALQQAFADASIASVASPVVLLAPACASFDQFTSYEDRGDTFRRLVGELEGTPLLFAGQAVERSG
jgi:UDP-N-acetylmuramoylalanine--D-glutamate ligase